ncbi:hypothetical protein [Amycolatopsis samaneae]|uniref:Secreted protein n=1 Tax=Amycolatopsis samaneae TaxID=664691 RepID=A0ABW5GAC4_9PSEU
MARNVMLRRLGAAALAAGAVTALVSAPAVAAPSGTWRADLSTVDDDDVNVRSEGGTLTLADAAWHRTALVTSGSEGRLLLAEHPLDGPASRVTAEVAADTPTGTAVEVDVRGRTGADDWTEWTPAGQGAATFGTPVGAVQVRISLSSTTDGVRPTVRDVRLSADTAPQTDAATAAAPLTYKVYGTREGLIGGTTANGHKIVARDHFVSFPSGRSLSPKGTGNYTARVCRTDNSRCEYAPVWEVGPWNEQDDYWNPASKRQKFKDLPQGRPEAQAAYQNGYNGGKSGLGTKVQNPAGIDLADGVFWDGLKLSDNAWVNVTYLWTGSGPTGVVTTAGDPMNVRAGASTSAAVKGLAANHAKVTIECYVVGDSVTGKFGTSRIWDRIGPGHYVSDTYLKTGSNSPVAPKCS